MKTAEKKLNTITQNAIKTKTLAGTRGAKNGPKFSKEQSPRTEQLEAEKIENHKKIHGNFGFD